MPKKFRVEITRAAQRDLEDIWSYIAGDSPTRAAAFIRTLGKRAASLTRFPERAPLIPEAALLGAVYRELIHGKYRIVFRIAGNAVNIIRIIHGARLLDLDALS